LNISVQKKAWFDHGQERGGSTLELVAYSKGQPKQKPSFHAQILTTGSISEPPARATRVGWNDV
jgi:hypothetical protein